MTPRRAPPTPSVHLVALLALVVGAPLAAAHPPTDDEPLEAVAPSYVPLLIHEAITKNIGGVDQDGAIATFGMPFPRGSVPQVNGRPALAVTGSDHFQFRTLQSWVDGTVRWALVDASADILAGKRTTGHVIAPGPGDSGQPDVARLVGDVIVLDTGPLQALVPTDGFRLFTRVIVDGVKIVDSPAVRGVYGRTTDGKLLRPSEETRVVIEENGPARALVVAEGTMATGAGEDVIDFTTRITARAGSRDLEVTYTVRNATAARPAHNLLGSLELAVSTQPGASRVVSIARHDGVEVAPYHSDAHLYQAYSSAHTWHTDSIDYVPHLPRAGGGLDDFVQEGYQVVVDGVTRHGLGDRDQWPRHGFLDLSGNKGGVTVAMKLMPYFWPAALEANGNTVVAGLFTSRNPGPYTFVWRQHESRTAVFSFHAGPAVDPSHVAERLDFPVVGRAADYDHYDRSRVFPYRLLTIAEHEKIYAMMGHGDHEVQIFDKDMSICRYLGSHTTGGFNNMAGVESMLLVQWLRHGLGGQYVRALDLALWKAEWQVPRSDDFHHLQDPGPTNPSTPHTMRVHGDQEHRYLEGIILAYHLTGDRRYLDGLMDEAEVVEDLYLYGQGRSMWQSIRAQALLAEFTKDPAMYAALEERIDYCSSQTLDIDTQTSGWGWQDAPDQGDRRYYVWGNDLHSEKPPGENFQTRGFFHASLGPIAWYHAARVLKNAGRPMAAVARGRMRDLSYWTRHELFPYHMDPAQRHLPYSYAVTLQQFTQPEKWDFHPILLGMAATFQDTKDPSYLRKGIEQIAAHASHDDSSYDSNLYLLDVRPDCHHFMAIYKAWADSQ